jgi:divalent metal cation (Fe/Co/Zn/Cd) transporter
MSYFLANELRKLIIGENISREMRNEVRTIVHKHKAVRHINNIRSMYIGNNNFILLISVDIEDNTGGSAIERITAQVKADILRLYPHAKYIYLEMGEN